MFPFYIQSKCSIKKKVLMYQPNLQTLRIMSTWYQREGQAVSRSMDRNVMADSYIFKSSLK